MKPTLVLSFAALVALGTFAVSAPVPATQQAVRNPPCDNTWRHEPVVVYEVTGGTLSGPVDSVLVVNSDGLARFSSSIGPGPGFSYTVGVGQQAVNQLLTDLVDAGALFQCDSSFVVSDIPLSTLTILRGPTRRQGRTFSWFVPEGSLAGIQSTLSGFIAAHFPPPPGGGGDEF